MESCSISYLRVALFEFFLTRSQKEENLALNWFVKSRLTVVVNDSYESTVDTQGFKN